MPTQAQINRMQETQRRAAASGDTARADILGKKLSSVGATAAMPSSSSSIASSSGSSQSLGQMKQQSAPLPSLTTTPTPAKTGVQTPASALPTTSQSSSSKAQLMPLEKQAPSYTPEQVSQASQATGVWQSLVPERQNLVSQAQSYLNSLSPTDPRYREAANNLGRAQQSLEEANGQLKKLQGITAPVTTVSNGIITSQQGDMMGQSTVAPQFDSAPLPASKTSKTTTTSASQPVTGEITGGDIEAAKAQAEQDISQVEALKNSSLTAEVDAREALTQLADDTYNRQKEVFNSAQALYDQSLAAKNAVSSDAAEIQRRDANLTYEASKFEMEEARKRSEKAYNDQLTEQRLNNLSRTMKKESMVAALGGFGSLWANKEIEDLTLQNDRLLNDVYFEKDSADRDTSFKITQLNDAYQNDLFQIEANKEAAISGNYTEYLSYVQGLTEDRSLSASQRQEAITTATNEYKKNVAEINQQAFDTRYSVSQEARNYADGLKEQIRTQTTQKKDEAKANLQTAVELLTTTPQELLSTDVKKLAELEAAAGMPVGMTARAINAIKDELKKGNVSIEKYSDGADVVYVSVDKSDPANPVIKEISRMDGLGKLTADIAKEVAKNIGADGTETASVLAVIPKDLRSSVTAKANQFDAEQQVKNFQVTQEGYNFVKSISSDTTNPADDQGFIYAFAKIMDPNSVVREGEYATVQKYAQSWAESFGFNAARVFSNSKFLSKEAIDNMKSTLEQKYNASKRTYDQIRGEYIRSIDNLAGTPVGEKILQDYTTPPPSSALNGSVSDSFQKYYNEQIATDEEAKMALQSSYSTLIDNGFSEDEAKEYLLKKAGIDSGQDFNQVGGDTHSASPVIQKGSSQVFISPSGKPASSPSTILKGIKTITDIVAPNLKKFADNCVFFARQIVPNIPTGATSVAGRIEGLKKAEEGGYGGFDLKEAQVGDALHSSEGDVGHTMVIIGESGNNWIIEEANYKGGQITRGRQIAKNDPKLLGWIRPMGPAQYDVAVASTPKMFADNPQEGKNTAIEKQIEKLTKKSFIKLPKKYGTYS